MTTTLCVGVCVCVHIRSHFCGMERMVPRKFQSGIKAQMFNKDKEISEQINKC